MVKSRLHTNLYERVGDFMQDVQLIFQDCQALNQVGGNSASFSFLVSFFSPSPMVPVYNISRSNGAS